MSKTMENFVSFELAKKLKDKGFELKEPYAMYNELGDFHKLYTSAEERVPNRNYREYYDYCDFDDMDFVAPTISQVLKWMRVQHKIHIEFVSSVYGYNFIISGTPEEGGIYIYGSAVNYDGPNDGGAWDTVEEAAMASIIYVLDKLI